MKTLNIVLIVAIVACGLFVFSCFGFGLRINTTDSVPRGVYQLSNSTELKSNYVLFCPDEREIFSQAIDRGYLHKGFCESGTGYMIKKVVAISGDTISIGDNGVFVNGKLQPFSKPLAQDGAGRELTSFKLSNYKLNNEELLTMTDQNDWSFDGRYYGLIKTGQIKGVLTPVWVKPIEVIKQ
jgi:conjugative transfer signal peptidase TraF